MHDVLRQRLLRRIESLPEAQVYQVLDYIEFLESKYAHEARVEASGLQKLAEGLQDRMRKKAMNPETIREAFQLISAADKVLSGVSSAGRQILEDLGTLAEGDDERGVVGAGSRAGGQTSERSRSPTRGGGSTRRGVEGAREADEGGPERASDPGIGGGGNGP